MFGRRQRHTFPITAIANTPSALGGVGNNEEQEIALPSGVKDSIGKARLIQLETL